MPAEAKSHVSPREQELAQRLALLRALSEVPAKQFKSSEVAEVTDFYWTLLNDSQKSWVFQRQAYINLRRHFLVTRENQLHELLKKVRPEVIALAQLNEKDIFEAYLGYE